MNELTLDDLIKKVNEYDPESIEKIKKAYKYADYLHRNQIRQSGEPYIIHPLNVAYILSELHADSDTICAGLLHDTLEDTDTSKEEIEREFNEEIVKLVEGVTKIRGMNYTSKQAQNMANTRKIVVSVMDDVRIIIIKLADRLHNMRTLQYKKRPKQIENAIETLDIFVPFAYYIGAYRIKSELEDISFRYLKPDKYKEIEDNKLKIEDDSKLCLTEMSDTIRKKLKDRNISNEIKIRTKNIYGIYKELCENKKLSEIHDLLSLKVMVETIENCYITLGLVHSKYNPLNDKFKDYIFNPKTNMYRSLHTTVFAPDDRLVQTQIRTFDMDKIASFGLTTYWDIMKGDARDAMQKEVKEKFQFYKSLRQIDKMFSANDEFVKHIQDELFSKKVYVYTPKGEIVELPKGSTAIDFAYKIHTDLGNKMIAAIVNEKLVPEDYELKTKDRVKIISDTTAYGPRKEWLNKVHTTKAKRKILEFNSNKSVS